MGSAQAGAPSDERLSRARESFERRRWLEAYSTFAALDPTALDVADLERLAEAAYLTGHDERSDDAWTGAYHRRLEQGDSVGAARCAFWLGLNLLLRGDMARANGWLGRATAILDEQGEECAVGGLLLVVDALGQLDGGDPVSAYAMFERARAVGERLSDRDVLALANLGRGQSLIAQADLDRGTACLDEAMVAVIANEVSVPVAGIVYCAVLLECRNTFDLGRAREWTEALTRWCATQPELTPYRGQCLVHRSEILQFRGDWPDALDEARRACAALAGNPAIGEAYYQQAEMHRLRGEHGAAATAYRRASEYGREPQPGLALLRLAQGDVATASASIQRVASEAQGQTQRSRVLAAFAEIALAAGKPSNARAAADELTAIAAKVDAPYLVAQASYTDGAVRFAEGDARGALDAARVALGTWQKLGTPYEAACARVLLSRACEVLGDDDTAMNERDAARATFAALGAATDLGALARETMGRAPAAAGLTTREAEVLRLVASGLTNREIAAELVVSDHTVRRHVQNIFAKTGVSTRAAATAYAYEHDLT